MIYSVWNQGAWKYDYYQSAAVQDTVNAPAPVHLSKVAAQATLGLSPEQACWRLPPDVRHVGSGDVPRGRIAARGPVVMAGQFGGKMAGGGGNDGLGDLPIIGSADFPLTLLALGLTGWLYWKHMR